MIIKKLLKNFQITLRGKESESRDEKFAFFTIVIIVPSSPLLSLTLADVFSILLQAAIKM
jgi:hypothetical protein